MKRFFLLAMCLLLLCAAPVRVCATEEGIYENAGALYEAWVSGGCVPDYITAVISTDGGTDNLIFGLVEGVAGDAGRREILSLVRDDSSVTFLYQTYSRNDLYKIQEQFVEEYFGQDLGLVSAGVNEYENHLEIQIKRSYEDNPDTQAMLQAVTKEHGDAVFFLFTDHEIQFTTTTLTVTEPPLLVAPLRQHPVQDLLPLALLAMLAVVLLGTGIRRRQLSAATTGGAAVAIDPHPLGRKQTENAIRKTEITPSEDLHERVMASIANAKKDRTE